MHHLALFLRPLAWVARPPIVHIALASLFLQILPISIMLFKTVTLSRDELSIVLGLTLLLDRWMYGSWVLVPLNFLKFNFLSFGGDYYGTHPWHGNFTQGFTVMIFTFFLYMVIDIIQSKHWKLAGLILWVLGLYSILGNKEFRFVLPVLPVALSFSGYSLAMPSPQYSSIKKIKKLSITSAKASWKIQATVFVFFFACWQQMSPWPFT